jgi:hypothetical protein
MSEPAAQRRELLCERCDREHPVWFAPNAVWNAVVRPNPDQGDEFAFLCPLCFIVLAEERGMVPSGWMVAPADSVTTTMSWRLDAAA